MACYPWWHDKFRRWRGVSYPGGESLIRGSGEDFVTASPESLRANAERALRASGAFTGRLTQDAYSLARNVASETGHGSAEQKMVLALSTINRAVHRNVTPHALVTLNKVRPGFYGRVHPDGDVTRAPYGRFTASSLEPRIDDLLIAIFATEGRAGRGVNDFARGADDQAQAGKSESWLRKESRENDYWVGDIPGIDPREITLFRHIASVPTDSYAGQSFLQRALTMHMSARRGPAPATCVASKQGSSMLATLFPPLSFLG